MCKGLKTVLYWLSIIRPVTDILIGTWKGIVQAIQAVRSDEDYQKQLAEFEKAQEVPYYNESEEYNGRK